MPPMIAAHSRVDYQVMRRTHSSLMRELGVDPKIVADGIGHDVNVNLNVYTQTSIEGRLEAVQTLDELFELMRQNCGRLLIGNFLPIDLSKSGRRGSNPRRPAWENGRWLIINGVPVKCVYTNLSN
jgi:hypothetical protein